jgi:G:T/U-mismatch repair DNA glycosylase
MRVEHRYIRDGLYTPENATGLVIGTFPSILIREKFKGFRSTDVDFFYGSRDNNFWPDMEKIYHRNLSYERTEEAVKQRTDLLDELRLGLSDAIFACETSGSAMDTALQNIELNHFLVKTLDEQPLLTTLYFTSSSGKVNAESLTLRLLKEEKRLNSMRIIQKTGPRQRQFEFTDRNGNQRTIQTVTLISPSPLAEQWGGVTPERRRDLYARFLPKLTG